MRLLGLGQRPVCRRANDGPPPEFSKPYWMARDYGLLVCSLFSSGDLGRAKACSIRLKQGETFEFGSAVICTPLRMRRVSTCRRRTRIIFLSRAILQASSISRRDRPTTVPPDVPGGAFRRYGVGFAFQVGPRLAGLFCNLRIGPGDYEDGTDLFLFDNLEAIKVQKAIPVTRNESRVNPANGQREAGHKFPTNGGFVPLGARRVDGTPHPHAGSGFGISTMFTHLDSAPSGKVLGTSLELQQYSYDGQQFRILQITVTWGQGGLRIPDSDWTLTQPGICMAIPDGDDLLYPAPANNRRGSAFCGVSRWQRRDGKWQPIAFMPAVNSGIESSLIRDADGSLLFCTRGEHETQYNIRVRRSTDGGQRWKLIVDKPDIVGHNPMPSRGQSTAGRMSSAIR